MRMTEIDRKAASSSNTTQSNLSSPLLQFSTDCYPFLNWNEEGPESSEEKAVVFQSLVATVKSQPALDDSLEAKAVKLLEYVIPNDFFSAVTFLRNFASSFDDTLTNFVQSIVVLVSSPSNGITTASMKILRNLITGCSAKVHQSLIQVDLIPKIITTLNPQSVSLSDCEQIHTCLIRVISWLFWMATPARLVYLEIEGLDEQQAQRTGHAPSATFVETDKHQRTFRAVFDFFWDILTIPVLPTVPTLSFPRSQSLLPTPALTTRRNTSRTHPFTLDFCRGPLEKCGFSKQDKRTGMDFHDNQHFSIQCTPLPSPPSMLSASV
ncbi:hypothetical protein BLNAU_1143 [Blattamonas nauphoetae]|uniref:Symplekin/Pta1 N-terminal domain-containing protein n=1 Tax=Blattamonas nauphoetae TaxID=2049346 RepID=A0ABQ9YJZ8_9EUKA|nr:hypothetical protein BLNAU_1143 [Blattamonas nauphoetae]